MLYSRTLEESSFLASSGVCGSRYSLTFGHIAPVFASVMSATIPLSKAGHVAKPSISGAGEGMAGQDLGAGMNI